MTNACQSQRILKMPKEPLDSCKETQKDVLQDIEIVKEDYNTHSIRLIDNRESRKSVFQHIEIDIEFKEW